MAHLVCQYIEFSNGGGSHRHIIGKRTDRASIGSSHASDNEDGNWKCERNRNQIPPGKMLGEETPASPNSPEKAPPPQLTSRAALGAFSSMIWIFGFPYGITLMLNLSLSVFVKKSIEGWRTVGSMSGLCHPTK